MRLVLAAKLSLLFAVVIFLMPSAYADVFKTKPIFGLAPVKYSIDPDKVIGSFKVGTFCLHHGKLRWGDLRASNEYETRSLIIASFAEQGVLARNVEDISDKEIPVLTVRIAEVDMKLCVPGISGLTGKPKATGFINVTWNVQGPTEYTTELNIPLSASGFDPRKSSSMLDQAIKEGARRFLTAAPSH